MIDRQHLSILREVTRLGSVTAAAGRLNLTQSALSHTIRRLEERIGAPVWEKQGRGLRLTVAGTLLLDLADRLLPQFDHAESLLADLAAGRRGTLRVGMECHPCQKWLMRVTGPYLAAWPDVDFQVRTAFGFGGVAALRGHEIDLLITPDPVQDPGLTFCPAFDYDLMLAVPAGHRLAARPHATPADLTTETLITVPVPTDRLDIFTRFLLPAACTPRHHSTAETVDLMLHLTAAGRGVSVIPDWLLRDAAHTLPIHPVRLGPHGLPKSIFLGTRRGEETIPYLDGFITLAKTTGQTIPRP